MENYVLALGIRGLKAYGETWTRGYRGIKPDEVPQRNLLREKFYAEVQPFAERMKKKIQSDLWHRHGAAGQDRRGAG